MGSLNIEGWTKEDSPFLRRISEHNAVITDAEERLWRSAPLWRHLLFRVGVKQQLWRWFYDNRYRMSPRKLETNP